MSLAISIGPLENQQNRQRRQRVNLAYSPATIEQLSQSVIARQATTPIGQRMADVRPDFSRRSPDLSGTLYGPLAGTVEMVIGPFEDDFFSEHRELSDIAIAAVLCQKLGQ